MIAASHPDFEMELVRVGAGRPTTPGRAASVSSSATFSESWESFRFESTDIRDLGDRVLVLGDVSGCGRGSGVEVDGQWAWIIEMRDGRAASLRGFLDQSEALEAAGLSE